MASHPDIKVELTSSGAVVRWEGRNGSHVLNLDRVVGAQPNWIGSATDLDDMTDKRTAGRVLDLICDFVAGREETAALYHDDGRLEWLVEPGEDRPKPAPH